MAARVAINGLGRIGRAALRSLMDEPSDGLELVAVNDVAPADNLAYLIRYDSVYGRLADVEARDGGLSVRGRQIAALSEKDPSQLPWGDMDVDLVFECTGIFRTEEELRGHLQAGARKVVLSAPPKGGDVVMVVPGVNTEDGRGRELVSTASCTTNAIAPVMEILDRRIGVRKAQMTTTHAYTSSQELVDAPAKKWRRGRAAGLNIVPTTTGAATATSAAVPSIEGRFGGVALRVPVAAGSVADIVAVTARGTTEEEINEVLREEARSDRYRDIVGVAADPITSADVVGDSHAAVLDLSMTTVTDRDLVKVMSWYDNEWGYVQQMLRFAREAVAAPVDQRR